MAAPRLFQLGLVSAALCAALAAPPPGGRAAQNPPAPAAQKSEAARTLVLTVTDKKGNHVAGLRREHFSVFDGELWRPPASLGARDAPATVGLLFDASGSMPGFGASASDEAAVMGQVREALRLFLTNSHPSNEYFLIAFNTRPQLLLDGAAGAPAVLGAFERLAAATRKGYTALYDALYLSLDRSARGRHPKRVVVMVTDGRDNASSYSFDQVRRAVAESDVLVYALVLIDPRGVNDDTMSSYAGRRILEDLTSASGGRVFYAKGGRELAASLGYLVTELRSQYTVAIPALAARKGDGWRDLKVRVTGPRDAKGKPVKLAVRARPGFYDAARR